MIVYGDCDQTTQRGTSDLVGQSYYDVKCNECVYNVSGNAEGYLPGDVDVKMEGNVPNSTIKAVVELTRIGETPPIDPEKPYDPNDKTDPRHPDYKGTPIVLRTTPLDLLLSTINWTVLLFVWSLGYFAYVYFVRSRREEIRNLRLETAFSTKVCNTMGGTSSRSKPSGTSIRTRSRSS